MANKKSIADEFPRSHRLDKMIPAELTIHDAIQEVEALGAHVLLTDAVILLGKAKDKVAEWYDTRTLEINVHEDISTTEHLS